MASDNRTVKEIADHYGLKYKTAAARIRKGIPLDRPQRKVLSPEEQQRNRERHRRYKLRQARTMDFLEGRIVGGEPDPVHRMLARMVV